MASGLINTINLMKLLIIHATQVVTRLRCRAIIQIHQCAAAKAWFHNQKSDWGWKSGKFHPISASLFCPVKGRISPFQQ